MTGAGLADPTRVRLGEQTTQVIGGAQTIGGRIFYRDGVDQPDHPVGQHAVRSQGCGCRRKAAAGSDVRSAPGCSMSSTGRGPERPGSAWSAIYRDQGPEPIRPYWCAYTNLFQNSPSYGNDSTPPPLVIATDVATFQAAPGQLRRLQHRQLGVAADDRPGSR